MNIKKLEYFVEIADCGSLTKASKKLFVSQPYLSKIIADFEARLNKKIFIRQNNGLKLTDEGHRVYLLAHSIVSQMEQLDHLGEDSQSKEKRSMINFSIGNLILKDNLFLNFLHHNHSSSNEINFYETTINGCLENVENGLSEFAILIVDDYQKPLLLNILSRKGMEFDEWDNGEIYYHLHRNHPLANQKKLHVQQLIQYPLVKLRMDEFSKFSSEKFKQEYSDIQVSETITVNNYHLYLNIVKNNGAFMIGNKWQISELEKMGIISIKSSTSKHKVYLGIVKKKNHSLSIESKKFIDMFKQDYDIKDIGYN